MVWIIYGAWRITVWYFLFFLISVFALPPLLFCVFYLHFSFYISVPILFWPIWIYWWGVQGAQAQNGQDGHHLLHVLSKYSVVVAVMILAMVEVVFSAAGGIGWEDVGFLAAGFLNFGMSSFLIVCFLSFSGPGAGGLVGGKFCLSPSKSGAHEWVLSFTSLLLSSSAIFLSCIFMASLILSLSLCLAPFQSSCLVSVYWWWYWCWYGVSNLPIFESFFLHLWLGCAQCVGCAQWTRGGRGSQGNHGGGGGCSWACGSHSWRHGTSHVHALLE